MAHVERLPSGSYRVTVSLGRDAEGKPTREREVWPTREQAERRGHELEARRITRHQQGAPRLFAEAAMQWLSDGSVKIPWPTSDSPDTAQSPEGP